MMLFNRQLNLHGSPRQTMPWVAAVTEHVNKTTGIGATCWAGLFGVPVGAVAWSARLDSQADFVAATASLAADDAYQTLIEQSEAFVREPGTDRLMEIVFGVPTSIPPVGAVALVTTATANVERIPDAIAWGADVMQHAQSIGGGSAYFGPSVFGQFGELGWLAVYDDMAACDKARVALNNDPGYMGKLGASAGLFVPGSGHRVQSTRIL